MAWLSCGQFIIFTVAVIGIRASPTRFFGGFGQEDDMYEDYDLYYDQKQNGTENIRVNLDGVAFLVPVSQAVSTQALSLLSGLALDIMSGGPLSDSSDDTDYYDQEISQSPYIETIAKPDKPTSQESQESSEASTQTISLEITPPAPPSTPAPKDVSAEENEIIATTQDQLPDHLEENIPKNNKRRFNAHRRNKHPFFRPIFNRFLSRLMPA